MKKKILIYFFIFTLIFPFSFIKPQSANANAGIRVVGALAEKAMISISEKAGAKYATEKASEKAIKRWNMELYEDLAKQTNYNNINEPIQKAKIIPFPENDKRFGKYGKIFLGAAAFLTGADIAIDVYESIKNAQDEEKMLEFMENEAIPGNTYTQIYGFRLIPSSEPTTSSFKLYDPWDDTTVHTFDTASTYFAYPNSLDLSYDEGTNRYYIGANAKWYYGDNSWRGIGQEYSIRANDFNTYRERFGPTTKSEVPIGWTAPGDFPDYIREYASPETSPERKEEIVKEVEHAFPEGVPIVVPIKETAPGAPLEVDDSPYKEAPYEWNDPLPDKLPDPGTDPGTETPTDPGTDPGTETPTDPGTDPGTETPTDPGTGEPPTDPPPGDGGNPVKKINWPKLKAIPMAFTTAFPFSLPWDIAKGLDATFGSIDDQKGPIKFTWNAYKESTPITFTVPEMFLDWFKYIRTFILIIFDIGFIYAVRKLLGGAS